MTLREELADARDRIAHLESVLAKRESQIEDERALNRELHAQHAADREAMRQLDLLYQATASQLATVRVALEAPNPCNLVEYAMSVKKKAGRMDTDIVAQAARGR